MYQQNIRGNNRQSANQQQPPSQPGRNPTNTVPDNKVEEKPLANATANLKPSKDGKTQPTCVVTPFVPLQVFYSKLFFLIFFLDCKGNSKSVMCL